MIRGEKGLTKESIADLIAIPRSNYSSVETGNRYLSIDAIGKIAKYFNLIIDQLVDFEGDIPQEVIIAGKSSAEQVKLIQGIEPEESNKVFKMVDTFITQKEFKDFFQKNRATL